MVRLSRRQALTGLALTATTATGRTTMPSWPIDLVDDLGNRLAGTLTTTSAAPPTPAHRMRLGVDFPAAATARNKQLFPHMAYHAVFGGTGPQGPGTALPSLTTGKMVDLPPDCIRHISWKGTYPSSQLVDYFTQITWPFAVSWWHEMDNDDLDRDGDRDEADAAFWRREMTVVVDALDQAANPLCVAAGPTFTTWFLDGRGDPRDFWVDGCTALFGDRYNMNTSRYRDPIEMFEPIAADAATFDVPWGVREWGGERIVTDTTGVGRAQWMRDCLTYLADAGWVAWWNIGGGVLPDLSPEVATLQTAIHLQAQP